MKVASLSNHIDKGTYLVVEETTVWAELRQAAGAWLFDAVHKLRLQGNLAYSIRWGPIDPNWGFACRSVGSKCFDMSQWFANWGYKSRRKLGEFPVSHEWVRENCPDAGWPWDDNETTTFLSDGGS